MSEEKKEQSDQSVEKSANGEANRETAQQEASAEEKADPKLEEVSAEAKEDSSQAQASVEANDEAKEPAEPQQASAEVAKEAAPTQPAEKAEAAAPAAAKPERKPLTEEEREARRKAAAEARAARAADGPKAAKEGEAGKAERAAKPEAPKEPSPNQPRLDRAVQILQSEVAEDAVEESSINENNNHLPTLTVKNEHWLKCAETLLRHPEFGCNYLRNVTGADHETHMEVVYHMINLTTKHEYCVKVKTDRDQPSVDSVTGLWQTANWNEREIYDLLGIAFPGHPDLRRIMMPDDWVGHPLRKDYVPLDSEV